MKVFLVEEYKSDEILAVFSEWEDAVEFASNFEAVIVSERTVFGDQPPKKGFNL